MEAQIPDPYERNNAPIDFEIEDLPLEVTGMLPPGLDGMLLRNGPNPQFVDPEAHWFSGNGMLHCFQFSKGNVVYRNRWVRTPHWQAEKDAGKNLAIHLGASSRSESAAVANTNVLWHGGRLLALEEMHLPVVMDPMTLDTLGIIDFDAKVFGSFTAHPKIDCDNGELIFFGYGTPTILSAGLSYGTINSVGNLIHFEQFSAPYPSMAHDFAVTKRHALFPIMPLTASIERALEGNPPYAWEPHLDSYVGVVRRYDVENEKTEAVSTVDWWRGPPCFAFHVMNAWETEDAIYLDVIQFDSPPLFPWPDGSPIKDPGSGYLTRWTLDLRGDDHCFSCHRLVDIPGEFPRIDDRFMGKAYRHGWFAGHGVNEGLPLFSRIVHVDHQSDSLDIYNFPFTDSVSEPVFVPQGDDAPEGAGWLLVVVFRGDQQLSDLCIFDAQCVGKGPTTTIHVPHRIPNGFHGNWIAAEDIATQYKEK